MSDALQPLVLCVDDDARTVEIISRIMLHLPVRHAVALHPATAIEQARALRPDLLILDLMLPGMSGWEVLDQIRTDSAAENLRVIVLTARDTGVERLVATNLAQVDLFLSKPFDTAELARHVLRLLKLPIGPDWPGPDPEAGATAGGQNG